MATSNSAFNYDIRVLACDNCGAPIEAEVFAGTFTCSYCSARLVLHPRQLGAVSAEDDSVISEAERYKRLREQVDASTPLPESLKEVTENGRLLPEKHEEAEKMWLSAVAASRQVGAPFHVQEQLYFLALLLLDKYRDQNDGLRVRSVVETSLELLTESRYRQMLQSLLAIESFQAGDIAASTSWLATCNSNSDDLTVDSYYRYAAALHATNDQDWSQLKALLGEQENDVPVLKSLEIPMAILRANLLEKDGKIDAAKDELLRAFAIYPKKIFSGYSDVWFSSALIPLVLKKRELERFPSIELCKQCYDFAEQTFRQKIDNHSPRWRFYVRLPKLLLVLYVILGAMVNYMPVFLMIFDSWKFVFLLLVSIPVSLLVIGGLVGMTTEILARIYRGYAVKYEYCIADIVSMEQINPDDKTSFNVKFRCDTNHHGLIEKTQKLKIEDYYRILVEESQKLSVYVSPKSARKNIVEK